jgi:hypothetical protein
MAERPLLLFGDSDSALKGRKGAGGPKIQTPSHSVQAGRMASYLKSLDRALLAMQSSPEGIEAERTLVFEVGKDVSSFYTAVRGMGNQVEWVFDYPEFFDADDDFYELKEVKSSKDEKAKEWVRNVDKKKIGGKIYCVLTSTQALSEMLSLWRRYCNDAQTKFPRGKTGLKNVFDSLKEIRLWGYKDRLEETGVLEVWREDLKDPDLPFVKCELELFYHSDKSKINDREQKVKNEIENLGGVFITSSVINEIKYHAILASLPRAAVESIVSGKRDIEIVNSEGIMYIRSFGQNVFVPKDDAFESEAVVKSSSDIIDEPFIALFDGLPQENHPFLGGRLNVDDPDGYSEQYVVEARKHGTSMASIIAHGDLNNSEFSLRRKIYVRPIMKAKPWMDDDWREEVPDDTLLVDKIHIAVRRLFEESAGRVAPTVRLINLSIGNEHRQFDRLASPLARLLDWLSYKYRVLFVVSAGNHRNNIDFGISFGDFYRSSLLERDKIILEYLKENSRLHKLLSPAESISALTVGSIFEDGVDFDETDRFALPCSDGMLSPISSLGMGINKAIKPDIVYSGGRKFMVEKTPPFESTVGRWPDTARPPGILSAAPTAIVGSSSRSMYSFGTSLATALISHESERCYDALIDIFNKANKDIPHDHIALLVKAMLVHGAEWGDLGQKISNIMNWQNRGEFGDKLHRYIGYGKPNIDRAVECAKNRVTLIGYGDLTDNEADLYKLPLPFDFSKKARCRRLVVTLAFFPPINPSRQHYRRADIWYSLKDDGNKNLFQNRIDADSKSVTRGTIQHEIYENDNIVIWEDEGIFEIKVNCRATSGEKLLGEKIPYAIMASFEIKNDLEVDVYARVAERLSPRITPMP